MQFEAYQSNSSKGSEILTALFAILLHVGFLIGLFVDPQNGEMFLRNVG
jgi:hypothetical protein